MRMKNFRWNRPSFRKTILKDDRQSAADSLAEEDRFLRMQLDAQTEYLYLLETRSEEERRLRHDYRQHLRILGELASQGRTQEMLAYLADVQEDAQRPTVPRFTANVELDALINYYRKRAESAGVTFETNIKLPAKLGVSSMELGVILGNLLENAVDAAALVGGIADESGCGKGPSGEGASDGSRPRGQVFFGAQMRGAAFVFVIENTYAGEVHNCQGHFLSTKHEGAGIGIASSQKAVEQLDGLLSVQFSDGVFRVQASIPTCVAEVSIA